jgi:hypothetical protein
LLASDDRLPAADAKDFAAGLSAYVALNQASIPCSADDRLDRTGLPGGATSRRYAATSEVGSKGAAGLAADDATCEFDYDLGLGRLNGAVIVPAVTALTTGVETPVGILYQRAPYAVSSVLAFVSRQAAEHSRR